MRNVSYIYLDFYTQNYGGYTLVYIYIHRLDKKMFIYIKIRKDIYVIFIYCHTCTWSYILLAYMYNISYMNVFSLIDALYPSSSYRHILYSITYMLYIYICNKRHGAKTVCRMFYGV